MNGVNGTCQVLLRAYGSSQSRTELPGILQGWVRALWESGRGWNPGRAFSGLEAYGTHTDSPSQKLASG